MGDLFGVGDGEMKMVDDCCKFQLISSQPKHGSKLCKIWGKNFDFAQIGSHSIPELADQERNSSKGKGNYQKKEWCRKQKRKGSY